MAKIYGLFGSMTGKLADTVMSVRNGEQIARKYQPVVYNPSTPAQVAIRARLKLMSQLSAVVAPFIAMPREGSVSTRNLFVKKNFGLSSYENNEAKITLQNVQLTHSVVGLSPLVTTPGENTLQVRTNGDASLNRVIYALFAKQLDGTLISVGSAVVEKVGEVTNFPYTFENWYPGYEYVLYAYGMRDNTEAARAIYGNLTAPSAQVFAKLIVTRTLKESDVTLTETKAAVIVPSTQNMGNRENENEPAEKRTQKK